MYSRRQSCALFTRCVAELKLSPALRKRVEAFCSDEFSEVEMRVATAVCACVCARVGRRKSNCVCVRVRVRMAEFVGSD